MKLKQTLGILVIVIIGILFSACSGNKEQKITSDKISQNVSVDSLITTFTDLWNQNDSIGLSKTFTNSTLVLIGDGKATGTDSIMKNLVSKQLPRVANLKITKFSEGTSTDFAFYTGSWTIDFTKNETVVGSDVGNITIIWKKQSDNSWKIELLHMNSLPKKQEQAEPVSKKEFGAKKG